MGSKARAPAAWHRQQASAPDWPGLLDCAGGYLDQWRCLEAGEMRRAARLQMPCWT